LNYIFLTLAFSRFRAKEIATKMLLGTSRWEIMRRPLAESLLLTSVAFAAGALIAVGLEKHVSLLLRSEIDIFSNNAEILWGTVVIILCSVIAALVPAFSMGKVKPIEVIKGESRKKDKMILGRVFIAVQAGICITIISISLVMYLQTRKMINTPLGYRTEGLIEVEDYYDDVDLYNILESLPCVNRVGRYSSAPISYSHARRSLGIKDKKSHISAYELECDREALSILGIEILEDFNNDKNTYFTKSSQGIIESLYESNGVDKERIKHHYGGIVSEFKFGNSVTITDGAVCIDLTKREGRIGLLLVEVNGDIHDAKDQIVTAFDEAMEDRYVSANPVNILKDMVKESFTTERNSCMIIGGFSLLCIILTIMALTALSSYYSHLHTYDTAIRKVLGISCRKIFWETIWGFIFPVLIGSLIGVPLAYMYVSHWLQSYVIRIANSPVIYAVAIIITLLATFSAVSLQTIRLMCTNPAEALKKE
jgi:putative ABC transport system permease protein